MIARYCSKRMQKLWSDENRFRTWLKVELEVCKALSERGKIPADALKNILDRADFDIERIFELEETTRHDVIAFLGSVSEKVGEDGRFIHLGMTSSDLVDSSLALLMKEGGNLILEELDLFLAVLKEQAFKYKYQACIGRTHGIHGEPTTFGIKMARFYDEIKRSRSRVVEAIAQISFLKLSGAVGLYSSIDPDIEAEVGLNLGLEPSPISTQVLPRDRHANYLSALALLAGSIENIAVELRHLQRTEVLEIEERFHKGQKGSSAMPHKKNPITAENLTGLARVVKSNLVAGLDNIALWHERDISHSSVERIIIPDSVSLIETMLKRVRALVKDLNILPDNMERNLNLTNGLIFSQNILLKLINSSLSREAAYNIVQGAALKCWETKEPLLDIIYQNEEVKKLLSKEELEAATGLDHYLRFVDKIFSNVFLNES